MNQEPTPLPVIFRAEKSGAFKGDVSAVFPTICADHQGRQMQVYAHVGQHSGGSFGWYQSTRAATPAEYESLLQELRGIYERPDDADRVTLKVCQRMTPAHRAAFAADYRRAAA